MKILHIVFNGIYTEGMAYQDNVIPDMHAAMGHEVEILASCEIYDKGPIKKVLPESKKLKSGVMLHRVAFVNFGLRGITYKLRIVPGLYKTIERINPDFIMMHGVVTLSMYSLRKYMRKHPEVRLIVDSHADFSNSATNLVSKLFLHKILWRHMGKIIEPYAEVFYGVLPARVDFLKRIYKISEQKCELLVMGADDEKVERATTEESVRNTRIKYGIEEDDFLIITGGKIDKAKTQVLILMEAIKSMNVDNVKLLIFGSVEDDLKVKFDSLVDDKTIKYLGWLSGDDTYPVIAASDLAIYPGRHSTIWEQTAGIGIPMLCKYWDGTTHVDVCGNARFIMNDSVEEISKLLHNIVCDEKSYADMKEAAKKAKETFSYRKIAEKCLEGHN